MTADILFSPFEINGLTLPNRIVMAPMTRNMSESGAPGRPMPSITVGAPKAGLPTSAITAPSMAISACPQLQETKRWQNLTKKYS